MGHGVGEVEARAEAARPAGAVPARRQAAWRGAQTQGCACRGAARRPAGVQGPSCAARRDAGRAGGGEPPAAQDVQGDARRLDHRRVARAVPDRSHQPATNSRAHAGRGGDQGRARPRDAGLPDLRGEAHQHRAGRWRAAAPGQGVRRSLPSRGDHDADAGAPRHRLRPFELAQARGGSRGIAEHVAGRSVLQRDPVPRLEGARRQGLDVADPRAYDPLVVRRPRTWLLAEGWKRAGGPISARDVPGQPRERRLDEEVAGPALVASAIQSGSGPVSETMARDTIRVQVFDASLHRSVRNRTVTVVLPEPFGPAMTSKTGFIAARLRPFVEHQRGAA
jgi:hypothetical protein